MYNCDFRTIERNCMYGNIAYYTVYIYPLSYLILYSVFLFQILPNSVMSKYKTLFYMTIYMVI
jgi:hypothetical protein